MQHPTEEMRNAYRFGSENPEGMRRKHRREDNIRMDLWEIP
jgi:hypothetical protein